MYKIQNPINLMALAFVLCFVGPVGSNAEIKKLEVESKDTGPNDNMIECVEQQCFKPITDCLTTNEACLNDSTPPLKANCYSVCSQKIPSIQTCYTTVCMKNNVKRDKK